MSGSLLTPEEVAEQTKLCVATIRRKCQTGELRASKPAGRWRIDPEAVKEWLHASEPQGDPGVLRPQTAELGARVATSLRGSWRHLRTIESGGRT
ncbi:MAG: helix-turn-helix domain-containing protein [Gaiellaceae bacterium]